MTPSAQKPSETPRSDAAAMEASGHCEVGPDGQAVVTITFARGLELELQQERDKRIRDKVTHDLDLQGKMLEAAKTALQASHEQIASLERRLAGAFEEAAKVCDRESEQASTIRDDDSLPPALRNHYNGLQEGASRCAALCRSLIGKQP